MFCNPGLPIPDRPPLGFGAHDTPIQECGCEPITLDVLVVEDDPSDFLLVERCLKHMARFEPRITHAGSIEAARFAARRASDFELALVSQGPAEAGSEDLIRDLAAGSHLVLLSAKSVSPTARRAASRESRPAMLSKRELSPSRLEALLEAPMSLKGAVLSSAPTKLQSLAAIKSCVAL